MLVTSLQFSIFSCRGCGRGHNLTAEKNEMLHPWHYKRSRSSKRSPLPYSHSQWYWHLVFLWSFVLIKKKERKTVATAAIEACLWAVSSSLSTLHFFFKCVYTVCVCLHAHTYTRATRHSNGLFQFVSWNQFQENLFLLSVQKVIMQTREKYTLWLTVRDRRGTDSSSSFVLMCSLVPVLELIDKDNK